jgi:hypothetical protein
MVSRLEMTGMKDQNHFLSQGLFLNSFSKSPTSVQQIMLIEFTRDEIAENFVKIL